jgi:hypothetical protein
VIDEIQPHAPRKAALPFLVKAGLWVAGVTAAALIGSWLEYYVFNPPGAAGLAVFGAAWCGLRLIEME